MKSNWMEHLFSIEWVFSILMAAKLIHSIFYFVFVLSVLDINLRKSKASHKNGATVPTQAMAKRCTK